MFKRMIGAVMAVLCVLMLLPRAASAMGDDGAQAFGAYEYSYASRSAHGGARSMRIYVCGGTDWNREHELDALERKVALANMEIALLVWFAQLTPQNDVPQLQRRVDAIVARIMAEAKRLGATVVCEYTEYYIDGQYVLIDPMKVIRIY